MKVGTDGVLLGSWCDVANASSVLDIGTGTGLIALMVAQRNDRCMIDALDIDPSSCIQAEENVDRSLWKDRIMVHQGSFQEFSQVPDRSYDLIVTNPPWFRNSLRNPDPGRSVARHACSLPPEDLLKGLIKLLAPDGKFCMIMPVGESLTFVDTAGKYGLHCGKITAVFPNPGKPPKRYLTEFSFSNDSVVRDELVLELDRRHKYSDEFKKLTGDFYLYFRY